MPNPKKPRPALSDEAVAYLSDVEKQALAAQDKANEAVTEMDRAARSLAAANTRNTQLVQEVASLKQILAAVSAKDDRVEVYLSARPSDDLVTKANEAYLAAAQDNQGHPQALAAAVAAVLSCVKQEVCR